MRQVEFVPVRLTEVAEIYSVRISGNKNTELQKFFITFKDIDCHDLQKDFEQILKSLAEIVQHGAKESFFRPEGKMKDRVCAIPLYTAPKTYKRNGTLRLYCIRISNELLIAGGGGLKTTQTYEEDATLSEHVQILQNIDKELSRLEDEGKDLCKDICNITLHID